VAYSTLSAYWTHVSCVYNTTHLCAAYNGTSIACTTGTSTLCTAITID
jgi:hypothetical protein